MPQTSNLYTRWALEMRRKEFFRAGQRVGVAVSGGPDSVLLLHLMRAYAERAALLISAVHFNHHLRGAESDGDEGFVREMAASLGINCLVGGAEVGRIARQRGRNLEATARELRYRYFFSLVDQGQLDRVATAHTANDQAETVLMRLLRGAGTRGLGGIHPVLDGKVVRPFLGLTRAEVMAELAARGLGYRTDSSNLDTRFRRNKIRSELLPLLTREYNPEVVPLLNQLAERARDDELCLERLAHERSRPWLVREGRQERIAVRALLELPPALARRVLRQMGEIVRPGASGLTYAHIERLRQFAAEGQSGKLLTLPNGILARREFSWLVMTQGTPKPQTGNDFCYHLTVPGELLVPQIRRRFRLKIVARHPTDPAYNVGHIGLDPLKLNGNLVLRNWRAGDNFWPLGSQKVCKLKELFREGKVPQVQRREWPVLLCGDRIVWVSGFPPSQHAAATAQSPQMLVIEEEPLPLPRAETE